MGSATIEACLTPGGDVGESCLEVGTWKTNEEGWAGSPSRKREQARAGPGGDSHGAVHGGKDSITVCFRSSIATTLNHGYSAPQETFGNIGRHLWSLQLVGVGATGCRSTSDSARDIPNDMGLWDLPPPPPLSTAPVSGRPQLEARTPLSEPQHWLQAGSSPETIPPCSLGTSTEEALTNHVPSCRNQALCSGQRRGALTPSTASGPLPMTRLRSSRLPSPT